MQLMGPFPSSYEDRVFNIDTFQGREEDVIIISLTRTTSIGFMKDDRRVNVMLTRFGRRVNVMDIRSGKLRLRLIRLMRLISPS